MVEHEDDLGECELSSDVRLPLFGVLFSRLPGIVAFPHAIDRPFTD